MIPARRDDQDLMDRQTQLCSEVAGVMGALNVGYGRLVEIARVAMAEHQAEGVGIHSVAHWLAWRTGLSLASAKDIVRLAERSEDLPCAVGALSAGELTIDQAAQVARHVPADFDESCTAFAKQATVAQLRKALPSYGFVPPEKKPKPEPAPVPDRREGACGHDDTGWWLRARLPADEGAIVEQALTAARERLCAERRADVPEGEVPEPVTWADALVAIASDALTAGRSSHPGSDHYLVHAHLEAGPHGPQLRHHLGHVLPDHLRRHILCDTRIRAITHGGDGTPVAVGRATRTISAALRKAIEHRDGGCAVPGCGRTRNLEIHHIHHWEDGGETCPANLVALCRKHHRDHHHHVLGIEGPAPSTTFTDRWGNRLEPTGPPAPPPPPKDPATTPAEAARLAAEHHGLTPGHYQPPSGEPMSRWGIHFNPNRAPDPEPTDGEL